MIRIIFIALGVFYTISGSSSVMAARVFIAPPGDVQAASTHPIPLDKEFTVEVRLDTEGERINTVTGAVAMYLPDDIDIIKVSTAGSMIDLWIRRPVLDADRVTFTGSIVGGVEDNDGLLFTITIVVRNAVEHTINLSDVHLYAHDGIGTPIQPQVASFVISALQNIKKDSDTAGPVGVERSYFGINEPVINNVPVDRTPPQKFTPLLGRQPDAMGGKWFIAFETPDNESGIRGFEVKEGNLPWKPAVSPFILQDQTLSGRIIVRAIDQKGNSRDAVVDTSAAREGTSVPFNLWWLVVIILGAIGFELGYVKVLTASLSHVKVK